MGNEDQKYTEAPASVNFRIMYKGVEVQVTRRDINIEIKPFLEKTKSGIDWALTNEFTAPPPRFSPKPQREVEYVPDKLCPLCGEKLVYATKKDGTKYIKCSTNKWNPQTKMATGCQYVSWDKVEEGGVK